MNSSDLMGFLNLVPLDLWLPFILISLGFIAIITAFKKGLQAAGTVRVLNGAWIGFFLEAGQPFLGGFLGILPGVFPETYSLSVRGLLGVVAGFLSPLVYKYILKRIAPEVAIGSEHPQRAPAAWPDDPADTA